MDVINASLQLITLSYQYIPCWGHKESQKSNPSIWCSGIIMAICGVMNGVIANTHNRPHIAMNTIMNVCSPNGLNEYD